MDFAFQQVHVFLCMHLRNIDADGRFYRCVCEPWRKGRERAL